MIKVRTQYDYVGTGGYLGGLGRKRGAVWVDNVDTLGTVRKWHF
jgi:hypothetical protein